ADLAVVNSCTVTHESEAKLRRFVRRLRIETVVMGCAAALDDGAIAALPSVRAVVGGSDPNAVLRAAGFAAPRADRVLRRFGAHARAWLKIQDGCDEHCTFCATTLARGANRSRAVPELVREAQQLGAHHAELVLTGVHIGTYGRDAGCEMRDASPLGELLEALVAAVPDMRFRLSSIEATEVDDRIARLLIEAPRHRAAAVGVEPGAQAHGAALVHRRVVPGAARMAGGAAPRLRSRGGRDRRVPGGDERGSRRHARPDSRAAVHLPPRLPLQRAPWCACRPPRRSRAPGRDPRARR
ncbi:MAG: hypothetical protein DMD49_06595, partial [Gemmatimonadetes bacterium]